MEDLKYKISFSEYSSFLQCPHKWYLNYCLGMPGDINEELIFGQIMHKSIETLIGNKFLRKEMFFEGIVKKHLKDEIEKIKDINFLTRFNGQGLQFIFIRQVVEVLKELNFFKRFEEYEVVAIEYKLDGLEIIKIENLTFCFKGYIDLVLKKKSNGRYLVIDWKSSRKKWDIQKKLKDNEDLFTQLGLYKHFYSIKAGVPFDQIDVKFFNIPREEPKEMCTHNGVINETYVEYLINKFKNVCGKIYEHSPFELKKARFITKKNYCNRCQFNKEEICNDYDEYQVVS